MFYRRTDAGRWIMCRAVTVAGAKREAAIIYRFGRDDANWQIGYGEDKTVVAERKGPFGKWRNVAATSLEK